MLLRLTCLCTLGCCYFCRINEKSLPFAPLSGPIKGKVTQVSGNPIIRLDELPMSSSERGRRGRGGRGGGKRGKDTGRGRGRGNRNFRSRSSSSSRSRSRSGSNSSNSSRSSSRRDKKRRRRLIYNNV